MKSQPIIEQCPSAAAHFMRRQWIATICSAILLSISLCAVADDRALAPLKIISKVGLPGDGSRFDYESLDPNTGLLYIAHMGAGRLVIFDTHALKAVAELPGFPGATGVLAVPALRKVFVSLTGRLRFLRGEVAVFDMQSRKTGARIPAGGFPDGLAYDSRRQHIFVSNERGGTISVLDGRGDIHLAEVDAGGDVGNNRYDPVEDRLWADVQSRNELISIDVQSLKVTARYPVRGGEHPHGLLLDSANGLAFIACDGDAKLLVFDLRSKTFVQSFPVGDDPDVLSMDASLGRLYVASESGMISVFALQDRRLVKLGDQFIARSAHVVEVDPQTHRLFLPIQSPDGPPVMLVAAPRDLVDSQGASAPPLLQGPGKR